MFAVNMVRANDDPQQFVDGLVQFCAKTRIVFEVGACVFVLCRHLDCAIRPQNDESVSSSPSPLTPRDIYYTQRQVYLTSNRQTMPELRADISQHRLKVINTSFASFWDGRSLGPLPACL